MGIILGSISFRGRFGNHFRVGDHFGVGIISGAVDHILLIFMQKTRPGKQVRIIEVNADIPHLNYHFVDKDTEWIAYDSDE